MAFGYKKTITIDKAKVPNTDRSNFAVLVSVTDANLKTVANGGHVTSSSGYDICFYTASDLSGTKLSHEIEKYVATTGEIVMWVKLPTVYTASNTVFYMGYGDSGITTSQEDKTNVWDSNYLSVWHWGDGSTLNLTDSKGSANGTNNGIGAETGKIDGGAIFEANDYSEHGNYDDITTGDLTISMWLKCGTNTGYILNKWGTNGYLVYMNVPNAGKYSPYMFLNTGSAWKQVGLPNNYGDNVYRYFVFTRTGTTLNAYVNGSSTGVATQGSGTIGNLTNTAVIRFGSDYSGGYDYVGSLDEVRISNTVRSADWIVTEYNNQSSPSTFMSFGSEETITPATAIKNINGLAIASVKNVNGLAIASIKNINGLA